MKIHGMKPTLVPQVPKTFEKKLEFRTTTNLKEYDAKLFAYVLTVLEKQVLKENLDLNKVPKAFAIFTDNGEIKISIPKGILGINVHLLTYAIKRFEYYELAEVFKVSVFLEELCHWLWNIEDEIEVKYKIFEIIKEIYPDIKFEQIYNEDGTYKNYSKSLQ